MTLTHQALKTAIWIAQNGGDARELPEEVCPRDLEESVFKELQRADYGELIRPLAGRAGFVMDSAVKHIGRTKLSKYRADAAQMRMLEWIRENEDSGSSLDVANAAADDFTGTLTLDDFIKADRALNTQGFIEGVGVFGPGTIRPRLTPAGDRCLDSGYPPSEAADGHPNIHNTGGPSYNTHITGPVSGLQQGDNNSMTVVQNSDAHLAEAIEAVEKIRQLILEDDLDESTRKDLLAVNDELESNVRKKMPTTIINAFIVAIASKVTDLASGKISALGEHLQQLSWFTQG